MGFAWALTTLHYSKTATTDILIIIEEDFGIVEFKLPTKRSQVHSMDLA